jgi:hypothetical protein
MARDAAMAPPLGVVVVAVAVWWRGEVSVKGHGRGGYQVI